MLIEKFTEQETSEEEILAFLDKTQDYQSFHREKKVIPGIFYLSLANQYLKAPIKDVKFEFKNLRFYPFEGSIEINKDNGKTNFRFYDAKGDIALLEITSSNEEKKDNISFAFNLPGYLLKKWASSGKISDDCLAIYNRQEIGFSSYSNEDKILVGQEVPEGRNLVIPVSCTNNYGKQTVEARANIRIIKKESLEKIIELHKRILGLK